MQAILQYRLAERAVETFRMKDRKAAFARLTEQPALGEMLVRMHRAQSGQPLDGPQAAGEAARLLEEYRQVEDEEEAGING